MKSHQSRPLVEELQELHAIAVREHGPHAHSTRLIDRALTEARHTLQQTGCVQPVLPASRAQRVDSRREGPAR